MVLPSDKFTSLGDKFGVLSKLGEGAFNPMIQAIYEVEQCGTQHHTQGETTCDGLPAWVKTLDHHSLSMAC